MPFILTSQRTAFRLTRSTRPLAGEAHLGRLALSASSSTMRVRGRSRDAAPVNGARDLTIARAGCRIYFGNLPFGPRPCPCGVRRTVRGANDGFCPPQRQPDLDLLHINAFRQRSDGFTQRLRRRCVEELVKHALLPVRTMGPSCRLTEGPISRVAEYGHCSSSGPRSRAGLHGDSRSLGERSTRFRKAPDPARQGIGRLDTACLSPPS